MANASIKAGDTIPSLNGSLLNLDGTPVDLTGASIRLHLVSMIDKTVTQDLVSAIAGPPTLGNVQHVWAAPETVLPGTYWYE